MPLTLEVLSIVCRGGEGGAYTATAGPRTGSFSYLGRAGQVLVQGLLLFFLLRLRLPLLLFFLLVLLLLLLSQPVLLLLLFVAFAALVLLFLFQLG